MCLFSIKLTVLVYEFGSSESVCARVLEGYASVTHDIVLYVLTVLGRTGASHMCLPSRVSHTPSTSLSGVLTSDLTPLSTFTLSGNAAISGWAGSHVTPHTLH